MNYLTVHALQPVFPRGKRHFVYVYIRVKIVQLCFLLELRIARGYVSLVGLNNSACCQKVTKRSKQGMTQKPANLIMNHYYQQRLDSRGDEKKALCQRAFWIPIFVYSPSSRVGKKFSIERQNPICSSSNMRFFPGNDKRMAKLSDKSTAKPTYMLLYILPFTGVSMYLVINIITFDEKGTKDQIIFPLDEWNIKKKPRLSLENFEILSRKLN